HELLSLALKSFGDGIRSGLYAIDDPLERFHEAVEDLFDLIFPEAAAPPSGGADSERHADWSNPPRYGETLHRNQHSAIGQRLTGANPLRLRGLKQRFRRQDTGRGLMTNNRLSLHG